MARLIFTFNLIAWSLGLAGCAGVSLPQAFDPVARSTRDRIAHDVFWTADRQEDGRISDRIESLFEDGLTAEESVQIALINNRNLRARFEDLGVSRAELVEAGLLRNPLLEGSYKTGLEGAPGPEVEATLLFDFLSLVFIPLNRSVAKAKLAATQWEVTGAVMDLAGEVQRQFILVQSDWETIQLLEQAVQATEASMDVAQRLHEAGNLRDLDLENEQAKHAQSRLELAEAEAAALKHHERLTVLLGVWGSDADRVRISGKLASLPVDEVTSANLEQRAVAASVDLKFSRQRMLTNARRAGMTNWTGVIDELEIGGAWTREATGEKLAGGAVSVPLPLFNWGQARRARARSELRRAMELHYAGAVEVRSAARVAWAQLQATRERARFCREVLVPLHERRLHSTQLQYNAMQTGPIELIEAKNETIRAQRQDVEALRDYWLARADMNLLLAGRANQELLLDEPGSGRSTVGESMESRKGD